MDTIQYYIRIHIKYAKFLKRTHFNKNKTKIKQHSNPNGLHLDNILHS